MDDDEKHRTELQEENRELLEGFHAHLLAGKTARKAAANHLERLSFFADIYLTDYCDTPLAEGFDQIGGYLGHWFIRKAMWSDVASMKHNIETFRLFYAYLRTTGRLTDEHYQELEEEIAANSPIWLRHLKRYSDPEIDIEDVWDYGGESAESPSATGAAAAAGPSVDPALGPVGVGHLILMLSGKVAKLFGIGTARLPKVDDFAAQGHWAACWRCDLADINHPSGANYILFTNASTLYSLVIPNQDGRLDSLVEHFLTVLHDQFELAGLSAAPASGTSFDLVRGQPRSLIGSQNEMLRATAVLFSNPALTLDELYLQLNRMPMLTLPGGFPDRAFFAHLAADPPLAESTANHPDIIPFPSRSHG